MWIPALLLTGCSTLGSFLDFSELISFSVVGVPYIELFQEIKRNHDVKHGTYYLIKGIIEEPSGSGPSITCPIALLQTTLNFLVIPVLWPLVPRFLISILFGVAVPTLHSRYLCICFGFLLSLHVEDWAWV